MKNQNQDENENNNSENQTTTDGQFGSRHRLVLPLMKTIDDAYELSRLEQDNLYISIFMIQCWLGHATLAAAAEYAEKKDPRTRTIQSGLTWRCFNQVLGHAFEGKVGPDRRAGRVPHKDTKDTVRPAQRSGPTKKCEADVRLRHIDQNQLCLLLCDIFRCVQFDDALLGTLREAVFRYMTENGGAIDTSHARKMVLNPLPEFMRLCDWLDSILHQQVHEMWYLSPISFDPDPEKRELATLGVLQRNYANATEAEKAHWHWHFADAAKQYAASSKFSALAAAFGSDELRGRRSARVWNYPDVDNAVIALWPLVKRHNWTYADLLNVIRPGLKRPEAYPCDTTQRFADYCNLLGLRKTGKGRSSKGELVGADVARRLLGLEK